MLLLFIYQQQQYFVRNVSPQLFVHLLFLDVRGVFISFVNHHDDYEDECILNHMSDAINNEKKEDY